MKLIVQIPCFNEEATLRETVADIPRAIEGVDQVEILIIERAEFRDSIPATHLVYREKNRGIIDDILRRGMARGEFRNVNVREATNALANMLYGTVVCGCLEGSSRKLKRMAEHCIDVYLNGVLAPKGPRRKRS